MPLSGQTAPREQLARSQSIPPRRRRYLPPPIVALAHDPALLFQRPTTPGTSLDHLKSRHLRHSRMISHTPMSSPPHPSHKAVLSAGIRFTREGMVPTILHLQRLASYGVGFHSYTEPHLATDNELVRNILLALLASLAKVEAQKISERTRAGMARAKAQGKRIGRPSIAPKLRQQIAERIAAGQTAYAVAKALGIDRHTAAKYG